MIHTQPSEWGLLFALSFISCSGCCSIACASNCDSTPLLNYVSTADREVELLE